jgi:hypothetical protein
MCVCVSVCISFVCLSWVQLLTSLHAHAHAYTRSRYMHSYAQTCTHSHTTAPHSLTLCYRDPLAALLMLGSRGGRCIPPPQAPRYTVRVSVCVFVYESCVCGYVRSKCAVREYTASMMCSTQSIHARWFSYYTHSACVELQHDPTSSHVHTHTQHETHTPTHISSD